MERSACGHDGAAAVVVEVAIVEIGEEQWAKMIPETKSLHDYVKLTVVDDCVKLLVVYAVGNTPHDGYEINGSWQLYVECS